MQCDRRPTPVGSSWSLWRHVDRTGAGARVKKKGNQRRIVCEIGTAIAPSPDKLNSQHHAVQWLVGDVTSHVRRRRRRDPDQSLPTGGDEVTTVAIGDGSGSMRWCLGHRWCSNTLSTVRAASASDVFKTERFRKGAKDFGGNWITTMKGDCRRVRHSKTWSRQRAKVQGQGESSKRCSTHAWKVFVSLWKSNNRRRLTISLRLIGQFFGYGTETWDEDEMHGFVFNAT